MQNLTQDRLKELLDYNPETGVFTRKVARGGCKAGGIAGSVTGKYYRRINIDNKQYRACRLAWLYMECYFPENEVDHINRIKDDDRWSNLRHVSKQCNARNSGTQSNNTSGITGVSLDKKYEKWVAQIMISGKRKRLGCFKDFTDAVKARWKAEVECDWPGCNDHTDAYCYLHRVQ